MAVKLSQLTNVGLLKSGDITTGLRDGVNVTFNDPGDGFKDSYGNLILEYESLATTGPNSTNYPYIVSGRIGALGEISDVVYSAAGPDSNINIRLEAKNVGTITLDGSLVYIGEAGTQPIYGVGNNTSLVETDPQHSCSTTYAIKTYIDTVASSLVDSVTGTANRITISGTSANPVVDIASSYVGQATITTLGTIATGIWNGSLVSGQYGGTGVDNSGKTITLGGNLTTSGAFSSTFTMTNTTSVTFPTSGTLATTAGTVATATNIGGGAANQIPYQTDSGATSFISAVNNAVFVTNGSGVPSESTTLPSGLTIPSPSISGGLITSPVVSATATTGFGTSLTAGTAVQNTLGYDVLVNICVNVSSSTSATLVLGVGTTNTPTTNTVISSFTVASATIYTFSAVVPQNYYLLVNTTGTIVIGSITTQVCAI